MVISRKCAYEQRINGYVSVESGLVGQRPTPGRSLRTNDIVELERRGASEGKRTTIDRDLSWLGDDYVVGEFTIENANIYAGTKRRIVVGDSVGIYRGRRVCPKNTPTLRRAVARYQITDDNRGREINDGYSAALVKCPIIG